MNWSKVVMALIVSLLLLPASGYADTLLSLGKPVTGTAYYSNPAQQFPPAQEIFPYNNVNDGFYDDSYTGRDNPYAWSFWLTPDYVTTASFTIDLQGLYAVSSFSIQNTHNRGYNDRSAKDFYIALSTDGNNFEILVKGTLPDARHVDPIPWETFNLSSPATARYVMFVMTSNYGYFSGGINELKVYGETVPIPGAFWLLGSGLVGLIGLRSRLGR